MTNATVRGPSAPTSWPGHAIIRWLTTNNPFYVISAGLFLFGLRVSFGPQVKDLEAGILMAGLAGYTLLLALTALTLVRFGNVWDDVRTVMLLVVLMFLATSVTFDELLVRSPLLAKACQLGGFAFAVLISETLLRGSRLAMPGWFRGPYYLILGLFFLYPLALSPFLRQPQSEIMQWGLFGFSTVAGLAFLSLLPAVRRGAKYVANNGSPWRWPLYPWVVFGMLALAVPARAYLMCLSMHWVGANQGNSTIFGGYFLAPFGLCLAVLLLEHGIASGNKSIKAAALVLPFAFIVVTFAGHSSNAVYDGFFRIFRNRLGGDPLFWTALGTTLFYAYAAARRVEGALGAVTGMLVAVSLLGTDSMSSERYRGALVWPIGIATGLQLGLGVWRRLSRHWPIAAFGTFILAARLLFAADVDEALSFAVAFHVALVVLAIGGVWCRDEFAGTLRFVAGVILFLFAGLFVAGATLPSSRVPAWANVAYPFAAATALGVCGIVARDRVLLSFAAILLGGWLVRVGWRGYCAVREIVAGLDQIVLSLTLFVVAVGVSLRKAGWFASTEPDPHPEPADAEA